MDIKERFLSKVKKDPVTGCWEWIASKDSDGYGQFGLEGKNKRAHRLSYELLVSPIKGDLCVCHHCDNPGCVNPDHLFIGTLKDNSQDCIKKGRHTTPFKNGHTHSCKLSDDDVRKIKQELIKGELTQAQIGKKFGALQVTIHQIKIGKNYSRVI